MKSNKLHVGDEGHLSDLVKGQKGIVLGLHNNNPAVKRRLLDMGITTGVVVSIKKIAPMGDPIDIELRGYEIAVKKADLKQIEVEVIR